jgi:hypothetical protein
VTDEREAPTGQPTASDAPPAASEAPPPGRDGDDRDRPWRAAASEHRRPDGKPEREEVQQEPERRDEQERARRQQEAKERERKRQERRARMQKVREERERQEQERQEHERQELKERKDATQHVPRFGDLPRGAQHAVREIRAEEYIENLVVGGEARQQARSVRLDPEKIEETTLTYVKPPCYRQAERLLDTRRVVVLVGSPHLGKRTAAICLAVAAPVRSVERIQSTATLEQLHDFAFDSHSAYFVDNLNLSQSDGQLLFLLDDLSKRLDEDHLDSYLVITINRERRAFDDDLAPYLVDWSTMPDRHLVLRRHVEQRLGGSARVTGRIGELLASPEVAGVLKDIREIGAIGELAELLVQEANGQLDPGEALRRHSVAALGQIASRFQEGELHVQCVMIALAVLDGLPVGTVLEAAAALRRRIRPDRRERGIPATSLNAEGMRRTMILETVGAEPLWDFEYRPYGRHPVRRVRLRSEHDRQRILEHLWEEHDELHGRVLEWLGELVGDERTEVHRAAALALGTLALYDFAGILRVLERWAGSDDPARRGATALALGEPAAEERYAGQVLGLLRDWRTNGTVERQWTAAATYGGYVGFLYPTEALDGLREIAEKGNPALRWVLARALESLLEAGDWFTELHRLVLEALLQWTAGDATRALRRLGRLAYVDFAALTGRWHAPRLLLLAGDDPEQRRRIATLWLRTLARGSSRVRALERLRAWFRAADDDERLRPALRLLLAHMAELTRDDQDAQDRLRYHLQRWSSAGEPSATAALCLHVLDIKEVATP